MPYSIEELKSKPSYQNILDSDKNEIKKYFEDEELKAQQSGSTMEAVKTLRDEDGFILSYEDPDNMGKTMPSSIQKVRLPMTYINAVTSELDSKLKKERTFSSFRPTIKWPAQPPPADEPPATKEESQKNAKAQADELKKEKEFDKNVGDIAKQTGKSKEEVVEEVENEKPPGKTTTNTSSGGGMRD